MEEKNNPVEQEVDVQSKLESIQERYNLLERRLMLVNGLNSSLESKIKSLEARIELIMINSQAEILRIVGSFLIELENIRDSLDPNIIPLIDNFLIVLEEQGFKRIPFTQQNPPHEIETVSYEGEGEDRMVEQISPGYYFRDKVLIPMKVKIINTNPII